MTKAYSCKFKELIIILDIFVSLFMHVRTLIIALSVSFSLLLETKVVNAQFLYTPVKARPLYSCDTLNICVMGDMMMHSAQIADASRHGFATWLTHLKDRIESADVAIANMEFTHAGEPYTGYPAFSAPDGFSEYLADCGFDIFLCANNHIFDKGSKGAQRTLDIYRKLHDIYGIRYCGLAADEFDQSRNNPLFITSKGIRVAIINFTYGTNAGADMHWPKVNYMNNRPKIMQALSSAEKADLTIVLPHWGEEYSLSHSKNQRETALWLIENGADMILGAHPHVVQDYETIDGVQVAYSLGNAISNMSAENTQIELMAEIRIVRKPNGDIEVPPIEFTWLWCSRPGGFCDSYTVLPIEEFIGRKDDWKGTWEYEKMINAYNRVRKATGIPAGQTNRN